jgi:DNA-binding CsgD family transcriptional regulator
VAVSRAASPAECAAAERVCKSAPKQLEVWRLRDRGLSLRQIAYGIGVSVSTVRSQLLEIDRKIAVELRKGEAA